MFGTPDQNELAQRQTDNVAQSQQPVQQNTDPQAAQTTSTQPDNTTSTQQLLAELNQQVAQVQEDVETQSVDGQQDESASADNPDTQTNQSQSRAKPAEQKRQLAAETNPDTQPSQQQAQNTNATNAGVVTDSQQTQPTATQSQTSVQPQLDFATPTTASLGSVAGESGISLSPPGDTGWFAYLLSRPQLLLTVAMYTLVGLILLALAVSTAIETKHHHFWQAGVSFAAILLIVGVYLFFQDMLFVETVVAGGRG